MAADSFVCINTVMKGFSKAYGLEVKMLELRLKKEWHQIVGLPLATHTNPNSIRFRKLTVLAENSAWLQQLVFLKPVLLEKINAFAQAPLISDIVLCVAEKPFFKCPPRLELQCSHPQPISSPPETLAFAEALSGCIKDPDLQASLTKLIAKALSTHEITT